MGLVSLLSRMFKPADCPADNSSSSAGPKLSDREWQKEVYVFFKERYSLEPGDLPEDVRDTIRLRPDKAITPLDFTKEVAERFGLFSMY